jgi:hypothetical protein
MLSQRVELAKENRLRQRLHDFALRVQESLDGLDFEQRQRLLRLVVEEVRVKGWQVEIRLRIPLDEDPGRGPAEPEGPQGSPPRNGVSRNDGLRSLQARFRAVGPTRTSPAAGRHVSPADRTQERELGQFQGHPGGSRNS